LFPACKGPFGIGFDHFARSPVYALVKLDDVSEQQCAYNEQCNAAEKHFF
jgi:hypothetical protein